MALTLLLFIPDLPRFDPATSACWTLLDGAAAVLRAGDSPLSAVPQADRVVAVAPVNRLLFIETALPPVSPAKRNALLRYAIEDKLTIDPSTVHAVVLGRTGDGETAPRHVIAAIDRSWLSAALAWMTQAGFTADSLVSSASAVSVGSGEWAVVLDAQHGFARRADGFVYNFDLGAGREPPFGLVLAVNEARNRQLPPASLVLQPGDNGTVDASLAAEWSKALQVPVKIGAGSDNGYHALLAESRSANLLSGEFAPRAAGSTRLGMLRPALTVLALIACAQFAFTLIDNARLQRERLALDSEMARIFKQAFPAAQAIVDAPLQMRRNLAQLKLERGLATEGDARTLIAQLTLLLQGVPGSPAVAGLQIRDGVATLDAVLDAPAQEAALQRAVNALPGAILTTQPGSKASAVRARITLKAGS